MEPGPSEEQTFYRDTTRKFLEAEVPLEKVRALADEPAGFERTFWRRAAELGFTSLLVPEEHGGGSLDGEGLLDLAIVLEEVGRLVSPGPLLPVNLVAHAIATGGSAEQQAAWLPRIVTGEVIASWAHLERGADWRPDQMSLRLEGSGAGFVLHGAKTPVEAGAESDLLLVSARHAAGLTQLLVPAESPGVSFTALDGLDLVRRFCEVSFDGVQVPAAALLGPLGAAEAAVERQLDVALALQCVETVGAVSRVFETTLEYMFDRFSFGRPLASYQALKHRFADMKMWLEACHATAQAAARAVQEQGDDAPELVSAAKAYVGDHAPMILQECIQMHGGMGVTFEHDAHLYLRRAVQNRGLFGTPSEHRERIAARIGLDATEATR